MTRWLALLIPLLLAAVPRPSGAAAAAERAAALLRTGRYAEARKAYEALAPSDPVEAAIGVARCQSAVGDVDQAARTLLPASRSGSAAARAELGLLEFSRGRHDAAATLVDSALATDPDQPAARFLRAELDRVAGRLDRADEGYRWFIGFYNREQDRIGDPETLRWTGLAAAQYARWNRNSGQFHFLVNTLYPDILKRDSTYWPAHLESALLFVEKFNRPDASSEVDAGLAINPNAAELYAARARIAFQQFDLDGARRAIDRALVLNPRLLVAHQLDADVRMVLQGPREALAVLERARALDPVDEETLGRLAAALGAVDGLVDDPANTRMGAVIAEAVGRNPHCGAFFAALAAGLDLLRQYPAARGYYEEARRRMPQLIGVPGQLGLMAMRLGDETRAREILAEASEADPFNIRVRNSLKVLELLEGYGTVETPHFTIRFDRDRDSLLAAQAARYLESEVYPEVTRRLGHPLADKGLIEIFGSARGESGHGWFSARMVGLPFVGTVGACAGRVVAIASPHDEGRAPFNWARVLKHEFVHLVNLEQTRFNVPRWFTEGLAVRLEGPGTPRLWDHVLSRRLAADSLFHLSTLNLGFVRPASGEDWALAYCQAELYTRYLADTWGEDALTRMLGAYAANLDTREALKRSVGVTEEAFEKGYRRYVEKLAGPPPPRSEPARAAYESLRRSVEAAIEGRRHAEAESLLAIAETRFPNAADWSAASIVVYRASGDRDRLATALARRVERDWDDLESRLELAHLAADRADFAALERWTFEALRIDAVSADAHALHGRALSERGRAAEAIEDFDVAVALQPERSEHRLGLARALLAAGRKDRAREALDALLAREPEQPEARELLKTLEQP